MDTPEGTGAFQLKINKEMTKEFNIDGPGYIYRIGDKLYIHYGRVIKAHENLPKAFFYNEKQCQEILKKLMDTYGYRLGGVPGDTSMWQEGSLWSGDYESFIKSEYDYNGKEMEI